jgi:4-amino-4-deoxy-L-arabinose transferase-like glycosyltransferase
MAFALLTKGLIGVLIPAAATSAYVLWQRDWMLLRRLNVRRGLALLAVIAAPWFVLAARANPRFLWFFFVREHFQRFLTPIEHRTEPWWFFVPVLVVGILPWLPQAVRALVSPSSLPDRAPRGQFDAARLLWVWCVFVLIFFSCSDSKLIPYILPAIPALALLCASRKDADSRVNVVGGALLSLASCVGLLAYASGRWSSAEARTLLLLIRPMLFCTCIVLTAGALASCVLRSRPRAALASLCVSWFLATGTILVAANAAQALFSARDVALALRLEAAAAGAADAPIFAVQAYQQSLVFYLQRPVVLVDYRDEFDLGLTQDPSRGIATLREFTEAWLPLSDGFAVMPPSSRDRLSGLGVPTREIARFPDRVIVSRR